MSSSSPKKSSTSSSSLAGVPKDVLTKRKAIIADLLNQYNSQKELNMKEFYEKKICLMYNFITYDSFRQQNLRKRKKREQQEQQMKKKKNYLHPTATPEASSSSSSTLAAVSSAIMRAQNLATTASSNTNNYNMSSFFHHNSIPINDIHASSGTLGLGAYTTTTNIKRPAVTTTTTSVVPSSFVTNKFPRTTSLSSPPPQSSPAIQASNLNYNSMTAPTSLSIPTPPLPTGIRVMVQRYNYASIITKNDNQLVQVGQRNQNNHNKKAMPIGLLVYISFNNHYYSSLVTDAMIEKAAKSVLNLPIMLSSSETAGESSRSGCVTQKKSMLDVLFHKTSEAVMMNEQYNNDNDKEKEKEIIVNTGMSMIIVPQPNLFCTIQHHTQQHEQEKKTTCSVYFEKFYDTLETFLSQHEHYCLISSKEKAKKKNNVNKLLAAQSSSSLPSSFFEVPDPSIPPNELYSNNGEESLYATFDDRGIPLTLKENGEKISPNLRTKLLREYNAQQKRYDKYLQEAELLSAIASARSFEYNQNLRPDDEKEKEKEKESTTSTSSSSSSQQKQKLSSSFLHLIKGTSSSNDQALEFQSDMGPLSHILEI